MALILFIEGDPDLATAMAMVLEDAGHAVQSVADAATALRRLRGNPPDVVLVDVAELEGSPAGHELLRTLRFEAPGRRRIPVLLITEFDAGAAPSPGWPDAEAVATPLTDCLQKPFGFDVLRRKVARLTAAGASAPRSTGRPGETGQAGT